MDHTHVKAGQRFIDSQMTSQPPEYRYHFIVELTEEYFSAKHIASGVVRRFGYGKDVLAALTPVGATPLQQCNFDPLVGDKIRLHFKDGGAITGMCTAVRYHDFGLCGLRVREVSEIELDKSGASAYPLNQLSQIERVS